MVPHMLKLAVPLDSSGVFFAVPAPVFRVAGAPLLRAVPTSLPIFRAPSDFLAVIIGATAPLAIGLTAYRLTRLIFRCLEGLLTVEATPFDHTGVVALKGQAKNLETVIECVPRPR